MEAQETFSSSSSVNPNKNSKEPTLCEECSLNPWKYRCPGCSIRSCSLPCVKSHKKRTSCSGKRSRTEFVPISQFDDNLLISDYNLLEEAKRVAETAQRMRMRDKTFGYTTPFKLPFNDLRGLKNAAGRRKTQLLFFPNGMLKRQKNQTRFDTCKKSICWTIEWRFHSTDVVIVDDGVDEYTNLSSVIEKHLKLGPYKNQLRPFCEEQLDNLKFFIRKNPMGSKSPFHELNIKSGISHQLARVTILEYPVIHVFLPSATFDFEIIRDVKHFPQKIELGESANNDVQSPKGVLYKEEEIEEDDDGYSMDPQILDLMKYMNSEPLDVNPLLSGEAETEDNNDFYTSNGFDFEQNWRDIYSNLLGGVNPDDFLNLDGGFQQEGDMDEELEEGEIPGL